MQAKKWITALFLILNVPLFAQSLKTKNVILVTLDGFRWQELFSGADSTIMNSKSQVDDYAFTKAKFWDPDENTRRQKVMPFLWKEVAAKGSLYGNRNKGCYMNLSNKCWFSYPGYNEIFTGWADDSINSNDKKNNPNLTVFEAANESKTYKNKVAAIASWDCFPYILNQSQSKIYVNAGNQPVSGEITCTERTLNTITENMALFADGIRYDIFTYYYAFEYLKTRKPRLMFIGFDETDENGHMGAYIRYLEAAQQSDRVIGQLWHWLQSDPQYKDQTTLIITCDHGRGASENDQWKHHNNKVKGSDQTWMAIIGPDTPAQGEMTAGQFYTNQIAQTIAHLLNINYNNPKAGQAIK
jgi:hypothetical protein